MATHRLVSPEGVLHLLPDVKKSKRALCDAHGPKMRVDYLNKHLAGDAKYAEHHAGWQHCISSRPPSETLQYGPISNLENARLFAASQFFTYEVCGIFLKKPGWERSWHRDAGDHARELLAALVAGRLPRSRLASRIRLAEAGIIPARCGMYSASADKKVCAARRAAPP
jgi:hypothetical protein